MKNKKALAILLSRFEFARCPQAELEQYQTAAEFAAEVLWMAYMNGDIKDRIVADLGCGAGVLGIGAAVLGAKKVYMVDIDKRMLDIARSNLHTMELECHKGFDIEFANVDVSDFAVKVDTVIQNPPFGVQRRHSDRAFLSKAMEIAPIVYSLHKLETSDFIETTAERNGFKAMLIKRFRLPIARSMRFHKKRVYFVGVGLWRLERIC